MTQRTATIIGATGLIGSHLVRILAGNGDWDRIRILSRRPVEISLPQSEVIVIDFEDQTAFRKAVEGSDALFCTVGTTRKKVKGNLEAYRRIDHDIPVNAARHAMDTGCRQFLMVSSVGASAKSRSYYLRFKGEAEEAIAAMGIPSLFIFRPSMLLGKRSEFRLSEEVAKVITSPLAFLFPSRYRPIPGRRVAEAMAAVAGGAGKNHNVEGSTDKDTTAEDHTPKNRTVEDHTPKNRTVEDHTPKNRTTEDHYREEHPGEEHTREWPIKAEPANTDHTRKGVAVFYYSEMMKFIKR